MRNIGSVPLFLFLFIFSIVMIGGIIPIPHYQTSSGWYSGPSFFQKILGESDPGISADKIYRKYISANIESPMNLTCQTDLDCLNYKIANQCRVYCGNKDNENKTSAEELGNNRVCDPAGWTAPTLNCRCLLGSCIDISN